MNRYFFSVKDGEDSISAEFSTDSTEDLTVKLNKFLSLIPPAEPNSPSIINSRADAYSELQRAYTDGTDPSEEARLERLVDSFDEVIEYLGLDNA